MSRIEPPEPSSLTQPYWDATREKRLLLQWCTTCEAPIHYPRAVCPRCLGEALEWREASGRGEVYAFGVHHRPGPGRDDADVPYVVALIALDEGARTMSNITGCDPADVRVGMPVQVTWEALSDGRHLPLYEPQGES